MDRFDREIIVFTLQWLPFGRPPDEDIFPRFGMSWEQLWARIEDVLVEQRTAVEQRAVAIRDTPDWLLLCRFVEALHARRCTPAVAPACTHDVPVDRPSTIAVTSANDLG
jgi:hypothetical protein